MLCFSEPLVNDVLESWNRHSTVRNSNDLFEILDTKLQHRFTIVGENRLERLRLAPLRMLRRRCNDLVNGEGYLCVDRLLNPERAVVIKCREPIVGRNKIGRSFFCYPPNEVNDCFLRRGLVPRGQWIDGPGNGRNKCQPAGKCRDECSFHGQFSETPPAANAHNLVSPRNCCSDLRFPSSSS